MRIDVCQLLKEPIGASRCYQVSELVSDDNPEHIEGEVVLIHTNRGILVNGTMIARMTGDCNRCLNPTEYSINLNIEEEFFPRKGLDLSLLEMADGTVIKDNCILDLGNTVRQSILAAIPIKLLCHPDCVGLCPICGYNLNLGSCHCQSQTSDPRWSELVCLKEENKV